MVPAAAEPRCSLGFGAVWVLHGHADPALHNDSGSKFLPFSSRLPGTISLPVFLRGSKAAR